MSDTTPNTTSEAPKEEGKAAKTVKKFNAKKTAILKGD